MQIKIEKCKNAGSEMNAAGDVTSWQLQQQQKQQQQLQHGHKIKNKTYINLEATATFAVICRTAPKMLFIFGQTTTTTNTVCDTFSCNSSKNNHNNNNNRSRHPAQCQLFSCPNGSDQLIDSLGGRLVN